MGWGDEDKVVDAGAPVAPSAVSWGKKDAPVRKVGSLENIGRQFVAGGGDLINTLGTVADAFNPMARLERASLQQHIADAGAALGKSPQAIQQAQTESSPIASLATQAQDFGNLRPGEAPEDLQSRVAGGIGRVIPNVAGALATGGTGSLDALIPAALAKVPVLGRVLTAIGRGAPTAGAMTTESAANLPDTMSAVDKAKATAVSGVENLVMAGLPVAVGSSPLVRAATGAGIGASIPAATAALHGQDQDAANNIVGAVLGSLMASHGQARAEAPLDPFLSQYGRSVPDPVASPEAPLALPPGADFIGQARVVRPGEQPVGPNGTVAVTPAGEAFTPAQGQAQVADVLQNALKVVPGALPAPVVNVDSAGTAMATADQNAKAIEAQNVAQSLIDATQQKRDLGITPDIERTQSVKWGQQDQQVKAEQAKQDAAVSAPVVSGGLRSAKVLADGPAYPAAPYDMTPDQIATHSQAVEAHGQKVEDAILGDQADAWRKAHRQSNSSNDARANAGLQKVSDIEAALPQSQIDQLYGVGETNDANDPLDDYKSIHEDVDLADTPQQASIVLSRILPKLGGTEGRDPSTWKRDQQVAYAGMRSLADKIQAEGWDSSDIQKNALSAASARYGDMDDAGFMLQRFLKPRDSAATGVGQDKLAIGSDAKFSFAGERAQTADRGALVQAQQMEAVGRDSVPDRDGNVPGSEADTHTATGWSRGKDGKWRFEIDDSAAKLNGSKLLSIDPESVATEKEMVTSAMGRAMRDGDHAEAQRLLQRRQELRGASLKGSTVGDVLNHPSLMESYPHLADVKVKVDQNMSGLGAYTPSENMIVIRSPTEYAATGPKSLKSVLLHEIQHAIQNHEGFARGGSSSEMHGTLEHRQEVARLRRQNDQQDNGWNSAGGIEESQIEKTAATRAYRRLAGETEARNTQKRMDLSAADRRATPPSETEDVPRSQQIVKFGREPSMDEGDTHVTQQDRSATDKISKQLSDHIGKPVSLIPANELPNALRRALDAFDGVVGGKTTVFENNTPQSADFQGVTMRDGQRFVNVTSDVPLLQVAVHEFGHDLRKDRPDLWKELGDHMEQNGDIDAYLSQLKKNAKAGGFDLESVSRGEAHDELVSDAMGDAMVDPEFLERLAKNNPTLFAKVAAYFKQALDRILSRLKDMGSNKYVRDVQAFRDKLEDVLTRYATERTGGPRAASGDDLAMSRRSESEPQNDIAFSRRPAANYTPEQQEFMKKAGMGDVVDTRTAVTRALDAIRGMKVNLPTDALVQGTINQFHGIKRAVEEKGGIAPENNPFLAAEMIQTASTMEAILRFGAPELHNGALRVKHDVPGLMDALAPVANHMPEFLGWMVARRAKLLKSQGRENAMSDADIAAGLSLSKGFTPEFNEAAEDYSKLKGSILDLAEQSGIIDPEARKVWDHAEYIPFYRDMDGGAGGSGTRQGLANQSSGIKTLKGGESPLKDPLGNIIANFTRLVDASMKNRATLLAVDQLGSPYFRKAPLEMKPETIPLDQVKKHLLANGTPKAMVDSMPPSALRGVGKMLAVKAPEGDDIVRVMRNGKAEYYHVDDPLLLRSLTAFHEGGTHWSLKPFSFLKNLLTAGATATPDFIIRNGLRDTGEATVTAKEKFVPVWDTLRGAVESFRESELSQDLMMAGASFHGGLFHTGNVEDTSKAIHRALRKHGMTESAIKKYVGTLINPLRLWDIYRSVSEATEMGSRVSLARNRLKAGGSPLEAAHEAKDFLNFQRRGDDKFVVAFTKVIPFLNARIQGADRMVRMGKTKGRRGKMAARLAVMALLSTALYWWNTTQHADAYDEIPDWDKDANWHIGPGTDYYTRIPKPFELGLVGGTFPERMYGAIRHALTNGEQGDRPGQSWDAFVRGMGNALGLNPIPQGVKPIVEDVANKDFYFGSPIEGMGDQYKAPSDRFGPTTSPIMKHASKAMASMFGEDSTISPKRLEHFWTGYTAGMGRYLMQSADWVDRKLEGAPETPAMALRDFPLVGTVVRGGSQPRTTRYVDEFYDLAQQAKEKSGSIKEAVLHGDDKRAERLQNQWGWLVGEQQGSKRAKGGFMLSGVRDINKTMKELAAITKDNARIYDDRKMTGQQKRDALDANLVQRNAIVRDAVRQLRAAERAKGG